VLLVYLLPIFPLLLQPPDVISITVISPEIPYIGYPGMPSPVYQHVINLIVSLPIRTGPGELMNVSVREHRAVNNMTF
jgi:hypothetical protein